MATPIEYTELLFKPEMFELIVTNFYAEYCHYRKQIERNNPNYEDNYWQDTNAAEIWALFGVAILMGINSLPQAELYFDRNQFIGNTDIKTTLTALHFKKLMWYLHVSDRATKAGRNDPNYDKLGKIGITAANG